MNRSCVAPFRSYSHAKTTHQPPPISESCILDAARTRRSVFKFGAGVRGSINSRNRSHPTDEPNDYDNHNNGSNHS